MRMGRTEHPSEDVQAAIVRLADALCEWERATSRPSVLIVRESDFSFRAESGKPVTDEDITDEQLLKMVEGVQPIF